MPNPISGSDSVRKPRTCVKFELKIGRTRPSLKPTRGVYSKRSDIDGRIRALTPRPKEAECLSWRKASAKGAGGKNSFALGSNRRWPLALKCTAGEKNRLTYLLALRATMACRFQVKLRLKFSSPSMLA